ncbi:Puf4p SCDLUD_001496 [Saccharomycodes ludwigii]|uniref:Puf4p n=1 Tax=Saccharomycodes ludwigii TaxID=36035 RepID=UPI001E88ED90|nr:hypothetical protein SCDLUD_001496 [Saccharomycodes ludwigii]KAH3901723.1 hypothetical protein SCDLUD_001496 [Saccharomycodes ludwigii]
MNPPTQENITSALDNLHIDDDDFTKTGEPNSDTLVSLSSVEQQQQQQQQQFNYQQPQGVPPPQFTIPLPQMPHPLNMNSGVPPNFMGFMPSSQYMMLNQYEDPLSTSNKIIDREGNVEGPNNTNASSNPQLVPQNYIPGLNPNFLIGNENNNVASTGTNINSAAKNSLNQHDTAAKATDNFWSATNDTIPPLIQTEDAKFVRGTSFAGPSSSTLEDSSIAIEEVSFEEASAALAASMPRSGPSTRRQTFHAVSRTDMLEAPQNGVALSGSNAVGFMNTESSNNGGVISSVSRTQSTSLEGPSGHVFSNSNVTTSNNNNNNDNNNNNSNKNNNDNTSINKNSNEKQIETSVGIVENPIPQGPTSLSSLANVPSFTPSAAYPYGGPLMQGNPMYSGPPMGISPFHHHHAAAAAAAAHYGFHSPFQSYSPLPTGPMHQQQYIMGDGNSLGPPTDMNGTGINATKNDDKKSSGFLEESNGQNNNNTVSNYPGLPPLLQSNDIPPHSVSPANGMPWLYGSPSPFPPPLMGVPPLGPPQSHMLDGNNTHNTNMRMMNQNVSGIPNNNNMGMPNNTKHKNMGNGKRNFHRNNNSNSGSGGFNHNYNNNRRTLGGNNRNHNYHNQNAGAGEHFNSVTAAAAAAKYTDATLEEYIGNIYSLCKDQHGCRFLQKQLDLGGERAATEIFVETKSHVVELMTDSFGNYLVQKLLECVSNEQRLELVQIAAPHFFDIALDSHGTRALQKLVDCIGSDEEAQLLVNSLDGLVVDLSKDLNGNHVIQKCLTKLKPMDFQFIFDAVCAQCVDVATHRHGCCVLQRCLDNGELPQRAKLCEQILKNVEMLSLDPFGNYVVQYVLTKESEYHENEYTNKIVEVLKPDIINLSLHKFGSNVIEKLLRTPLVSARIVSDLVNNCGEEGISRLLHDSYGNYVLQTSLDVVQNKNKYLFDCLSNIVKPLLVGPIRNTPHGRRMVTMLQLE